MMSMLNQAAVEALCSATYLENYLDCMENLPDDLQRIVTQLRELDSTTHELLGEIVVQKDTYLKQEDGAQKKRALISIQRKLIKSQELGDEKLALVSSIIEHIENRTRQLEQDLENLDPGTTVGPPSGNKDSQESAKPGAASGAAVSLGNTGLERASAASSSAATPKEVPSRTPKCSGASAATAASVASAPPVANTAVQGASSQVHSAPLEEKSEAAKSKRQRRQRTHADISLKEEEKKEEEQEKPKKKKKRKTKAKDKEGDRSPVEPPIDPDEPTYCLCQQVSYGEMIGCDYDKCPIEWFHFNCVGLTHKPKGKWYCPKCRGDKPTVMRSDLLEQIKREKAKGN